MVAATAIAIDHIDMGGMIERHRLIEVDHGIEHHLIRRILALRHEHP